MKSTTGTPMARAGIITESDGGAGWLRSLRGVSEWV